MSISYAVFCLKKKIHRHHGIGRKLKGLSHGAQPRHRGHRRGAGYRHRPRTFRFFFNDTATTEIYTLSLHDALPICCRSTCSPARRRSSSCLCSSSSDCTLPASRSEEHTSELPSHVNLVCRLLLEKKKKTHPPNHLPTQHTTLQPKQK